MKTQGKPGEFNYCENLSHFSIENEESICSSLTNNNQKVHSLERLLQLKAKDGVN